MKKLELVTNKLDIMTGELNEALNLKDLEMADLLKLQVETEQKLDQVQTEVYKMCYFNLYQSINILSLLNVLAEKI